MDRIEIRWLREGDNKTRIALAQNLSFMAAFRLFHFLEELSRELEEEEIGEPQGHA